MDDLPAQIPPEENPRAVMEHLEAENRRLSQENEALRSQMAGLWESESRLRRLTEGSILGVVVFDERGWVLQANATYLSLIGRTPADVTQKRLHWTQWVTEAEWPTWCQARAQLQDGAMTLPWENSFEHPDGTIQPVLTAATLLPQPGGDELRPLGQWGEPEVPEAFIRLGAPTVLAYALDIAPQKRIEAELRASEERLRTILESLREGLLITDLEDVVLYSNGRMSELSGFSAEEFRGRPAYEVLTPPERWGEIQEQTRRRATGESSQYEVLQRRRDGSEWVGLISASPLRDADGRIVGTVGAHSDITETKAAQERARRFAERLEASNRDLQAFAYAVSHDLKEPLRKVQVFGERIEKRAGPALDADSLDYLRRMRSAAARMGGLIDGLLELSRVTTRTRGFAPVDLNVTALEVMSDLQIAREQAGGEITIGELPVVYGDQVQLRQLLQNLLANAIKYRRPEEPLRVTIRGWSGSEDSGFTVTDNGIGFESRDAARIFEVFMRLAPRTAETEGVGIGLAICRKIVERHGGSISAEGRPGEGAVFTVRLPKRSLD